MLMTSPTPSIHRKASLPLDENQIQTQLAKISILTAAVAQSAYSSPHLNLSALEPLISQLDEWLSSLPPFMQLMSLREDDPGGSARRAILLTHITYLNARVIVSRRTIIEQTRWGNPNQHLEHVEAGISAAIQTQRIVGMLLENKEIWRKCWLLLYGPREATDLVDNY